MKSPPAIFPSLEFRRFYFFNEASSFLTVFSSFLIFLLTPAKLYHCSFAAG